MGCGASKSAEQLEMDFKVEKSLLKLRNCLNTLMLTSEDIDSMKKSFNKIDLTRDGCIDAAEFEIYLKTERAPFNERALRMYDTDQSGQLEFPEFLLMCWTYCTMDSGNLEKFVFDLYDDNKSGYMTGDEIEQLAKDLFGGKVNGHVQAIVKDLPKGNVTFNDFQHFVKKHQALMLPAFELQSDLRHHVIHDSFWIHKSVLRRTIPPLKVVEALTLGRRILSEEGTMSTKRKTKKISAMKNITVIPKKKLPELKASTAKKRNSVGSSHPVSAIHSHAHTHAHHKNHTHTKR